MRSAKYFPASRASRACTPRQTTLVTSRSRNTSAQACVVDGTLFHYGIGQAGRCLSAFRHFRFSPVLDGHWLYLRARCCAQIRRHAERGARLRDQQAGHDEYAMPPRLISSTPGHADAYATIFFFIIARFFSRGGAGIRAQPPSPYEDDASTFGCRRLAFSSGGRFTPLEVLERLGD